MRHRVGKLRNLGRVMLALASVAVTACSPLEALDRLVPEDTYSAETGIRYAPGKRGFLDVYTPRESAGPTPVMVFFYGGSWKSGERGDYRFVGEAMARRGITTVIPDYRLYPDVRFPAFLEDSAAAVAWVRANIGQHGGDPARVFLAGHSAGGYNAAMLAVNGDYLRAVGETPAALCGVVTLAGPVSFDPTDYNTTRPIFEHVGDSAQTRPVKFVGPGAPPFLLLHGKADSTVYPVNAEEFAEAMRQADNPVTLDLLPGIGHYRIIAALASPLEEWLLPLGDRVAAFVNSPENCASSSRLARGSG